MPLHQQTLLHLANQRVASVQPVPHLAQHHQHPALAEAALEAHLQRAALDKCQQVVNKIKAN
jgi:hypothetical protein